MALASLFLRLATVNALRGRTLGGDRVSDSQISAIDARVKDERKPALVVYSEDSTVDQVSGRDMLGGSRSLQLTIEILVADQVETEGVVTVSIPETDEGLELTLDLIERQILGTLQAGGSGWPEIWRGLIAGIHKVEGRRGAGLKEGVRFAARQLTITVEPLDEPAFGEAPTGAWRAFLDQLAEEPALADLASLLEAEFVGAARPDWRVAQGLLGLTLDGVRDMGVGLPYAPDSDVEAAVDLERVTIADGVGSTLIEGA